VNCPTCNGAGWKRYGFMHLRSKICSDCGGTGRDKRYDRQLSRAASSATTLVRQPLQREPVRPADNYSRFRPDDEEDGNPLIAAIAAEALGGDGTTAAITTILTGDTELGILTGALDQDDSEHHLDSDDREHGELSERDEPDDHDDNDSNDSSDSDSCGSND
jgi:hypothetical protein